jgi:hypothetical protein
VRHEQEQRGRDEDRREEHAEQRRVFLHGFLVFGFNSLRTEKNTFS